MGALLVVDDGAALREVAPGGDAAAAADLVELSGKLGIAKKNYAEVASFLRDNTEPYTAPAPTASAPWRPSNSTSTGRGRTRCRAGLVCCGSGRHGEDTQPHGVWPRAAQADRELSVTPRRRRRAEAREMRALASMVDTKVPPSVGKGRGAEHVSPVACMSAQVRYAAGIDSGMVATGW